MAAEFRKYEDDDKIGHPIIPETKIVVFKVISYLLLNDFILTQL